MGCTGCILCEQRLKFNSKVDDFESAAGPGGYRSSTPRHRTPFNSRNEGSEWDRWRDEFCLT